MASDVDQTNPDFLQNLGASIGKLSVAMEGFSHSASHFRFIWDLQFTSMVEPKLKMIKEDDKRKLCYDYLDRFQLYLEPLVIGNKLRRSIIHGDLNDMNMLCDAKGKRVIAFLDFGDSKESCTVFDLAICIAYFMLNKSKEQSIRVLHQISKAYHQMYRLTESEIDALWVAVCSRILTSAVVGYEKILQRPENS